MTKTEWQKMYRDHPNEVGDISVVELKLLMAYRRDMTEITKWDIWIENYLEEIRDRHDRDIAEVGREVLERETEEEVESKDAVKH
jgi:hypothetical protein